MQNKENEDVLISVIIPCFNYGMYIDHAIASIKAQTHKAFEIIIVDDGSTDEYTRDKLRALHDPMVRIIRTENNGPAAARNVGFTYARGKYILLWDADDLFHETFTEKALTILTHYPRIGAVSSWALCFGDEDYTWYPIGGSVENFMQSTTSPACALVRPEAWMDAEGFDERYLVGYEDWDFWIRITKKNWLVYIIPELLYYYRQKKQSRVKETFKRHIEIYEHIVARHPDVFTVTEILN